MTDPGVGRGIGEEMVLRQRAEQRLFNPSPNRRRYPAHAPWYFSKARGHWLSTADGDYLDLYLGRGTSVLGYSAPEVTAAAGAHLAVGFLASLRHCVEVELAELICALLPSADKVLFAKNGSDACTLAIRAARTASGRDLVLSSGFHGFGDVFHQGTGRAGFAQDSSTALVAFDPSRPEELAALVSQYADSLAAVILDPLVREDVDRETVVLARELTRQHGAVLIFDEVVTGFRVDVGGAQALLGVVPDLTCLGKVMGNGYPLSALAGDSAIMDSLLDTYFSSTYQSESLGCAIALACLRTIVDRQVPDTLTVAGERLRSLFDQAAETYGVKARAIGPPSRLELVFGEPSESVDEFASGMAAAHIVPSLSVFVSATFGDVELRHAEDGFAQAFQRVRDHRDGARQAH